MKPIKLLVVLFFSLFAVQHVYSQNIGYIYTVAGFGNSGFSGDGGPATSAMLDNPIGVTLDQAGNMYITDQGNNRIRKVNAAGIISTIASNVGFLEGPVAVDNAGNVYFADRDDHKIRKVDLNNVITDFAGTGTAGYSGDGGTALNAQLDNPISCIFDPAGNMYVAEKGNKIVRKITPSGIVSTVAGNGTAGFSGDGGPAAQAQMKTPRAICLDPVGNLYIADFENCRIRKVSPNGFITTVAGTGMPGYSGDGGPATLAEIGFTWGGLATDNSGNLFIADKDHHCIRMVDDAGIITTVIGNGNAGYSGDGSPAEFALLNGPTNMCLANSGLYVCDHVNNVVRKMPVPYSADSFSAFISGNCTGINLIIYKSYYAPGMTIHTDFGDGNTSVAGINSNNSGGYASISHNYAGSGTYTVKQKLYYGTTLVDSTAFSYNFLFCSTMPVHLYYDMDNDCVYNSTSDYKFFLPALVEVSANNIPVDTISCTSGFTYTAYGTAGDVYKFKLINLPGDVNSTCPVDGTVSNILQGGQSATKYIGMDCSPGNDFDLEVHAGSEVTLTRLSTHIYSQNLFCSPQYGTLTMQYDPAFTIVHSIEPAPMSQTSTSITWNLGILSSMTEAEHLFVNLGGSQWPTGTPVSTTYTIAPDAGDEDPDDNTVIIIDTVTGGYDPNAIYVKPAGCVPAGTNLEYTITFENMGNGPAENIFVLDTLPAGLDPGSMRLKFASHNMYVEKIYNDEQVIFKFNFQNIMLPDSSDPGRHGMLVYTIDAKSTLAFGDNIQHDASIYFDYNPPVLTNTSQTGICWPANVNTASTSNQANISLYPNPATDELTIKTEKQYSTYTISNSIGQVLLEQTMDSKEAKVNINNLAPGMYYISLNGERGMEVRKFVKM